MRAIRELVRREGIECDLMLTRSFDVLLDEAHAEAAKEAFDALLEEGLSTVDEVQYTPGKYAEAVRSPRPLIVPTYHPSHLEVFV